MILTGSSIYIFYVLVFMSGALALHAVALAGRQASRNVRLANSRLRRMASDSPNVAVLAKMRKSRSLNKDGDLTIVIEWINRLVLQSGAPLGRWGIYIIMAILPVVLALALFIFKGEPKFALAGAIAGLVLPIIGLKHLVKRRRAKAGRQLPEALDVIVRSLSAGHPVPVAMAMVGREMADPIGSEFGIASDEISYGASLGAGIARMSKRIGHPDFDLFSATVRLQERTGGNLAELLRNNAKTVRDRQRMRLKIKAASAEGRMSALILNVTPILLYAAIKLTAPSFYGDVEGHPYLTYGAWGVLVWMTIGNLVMHKMIKFRI
ncbi:MAG: type II secretion system F family protein [Robiginitomaculum sp.]